MEIGIGLGITNRGMAAGGGGSGPAAPTLLYHYSPAGPFWQNGERTTPATANGDPVTVWDEAVGGGYATAQTTGATLVISGGKTYVSVPAGNAFTRFGLPALGVPTLPAGYFIGAEITADDNQNLLLLSSEGGETDAEQISAAGDGATMAAEVLNGGSPSAGNLGTYSLNAWAVYAMQIGGTTDAATAVEYTNGAAGTNAGFTGARASYVSPAFQIGPRAGTLACNISEVRVYTGLATSGQVSTISTAMAANHP